MGALKERPLLTWCDASLYARLPGVVTRSKAGTWVWDVFGCLTGCCMWRLMQIGECHQRGACVLQRGATCLVSQIFAWCNKQLLAVLAGGNQHVPWVSRGHLLWLTC